MKLFTSGAAIVLALCTASCAEFEPRRGVGTWSGNLDAGRQTASRAPPMDANRLVAERDCTTAYPPIGGNLRCM
jgi:hypothetical protein